MISNKAAVIEVFTKAQAMVSAGWCQRIGRINGCVCAVQAIAEAADSGKSPFSEAAPFSEAVRVFKNANAIICSIDEWNDAPERTKPKVVAAFTKAIKFARAA